MGKIHKLTKEKQTIYPATITDAVVHPDLKVSTSKLIEEINVSKLFPTGGIDGSNKYTLETAIAKIPKSLQTVGIKCSFLGEGGEPETWEYQGGYWGDVGNWIPIDNNKFLTRVFNPPLDKAVVELYLIGIDSSHKYIINHFYRSKEVGDKWRFAIYDTTSSSQICDLNTDENPEAEDVISLYGDNTLRGYVILDWTQIEKGLDYAASKYVINNLLASDIRRNSSIENWILNNNMKNIDFNSIGESIKDILGSIKGGQTIQYNHFNGTTSLFVLPKPICLQEIGDFVEIRQRTYKNNTYNQAFNLIVGSNPGFSNTYIGYYNDNTIYVNVQSARYIYTNDKIKRGEWQTLRVICVDNSNGFVYNLYVDGELLAPATSPSVNSSLPMKMTNLGGMTSFCMCDIAYVSYLSENTFGNYVNLVKGTDVELTISNTTDVTKRISDLDSQVQALSQVITTKRMFYQYVAESANWDVESHLMIYVQINEDMYVGYMIGLWTMHNSSPMGISKCWRIVKAEIYSYDGNTMIRSENRILTDGESEFVLRQTNPVKKDFTGGYHGDESLDLEGGFVEFFADHTILELSKQDLPLTECRNFFYKQKSALYESANQDDSPTNVGRQIAWHMKETEITTRGYRTINRIDFVEQIPFYAYFGIVCVDRYVSEQAMGESFELTNMGTGTPTQVQQFLSYGDRTIYYKGNNIVLRISSKIIFGDDDDKNQLVVYNHTQYNKYYRKTTEISGLKSIKGECVVRIDYVE